MFSIFTWQNLDRASIIIGIVMFIPVLYSAGVLMMERRKKRQRIDEIRSTPGDCPSVLIVEVKKPDAESMRIQVEKYIRSEAASIIVPDEAVFIAEFNGIMQSKDMDSFMAKVRKRIGKAVAYGTDKIHLFMRCPLPVAASVGEYLSNSNVRIILHHNQPGEGYQNWGLLNR